MNRIFELFLFPIRMVLGFLFGRRDMVFLPEDHPDMEKAKEEARASFSEFKRLLTNPDAGMENFSVKVAFPLESGTEHIWVSDLEIEDGVIKGKVGNVPKEIEDLEYGSPLVVEDRAVSDWAYSRNGYFHGHFTTRILLPRMNKKMRMQVLEILGWKDDQG